MSVKKKSEPVKAPVNPIIKNESPAKDLFSNLGRKARLLALAIILLIGSIIFKDYLLLEKAYTFKDIGSDSYNYSYPYLHHVAEYIANHGLPKWSFHFGMGQSLFPFFLRDPFDIFLYMSGKDHILFGIVFEELAKIIMSGITFYYYLKALKLSDYTAIIGSLLFAFSSFAIVGGGWYIFSFEAFNMALLLLAFEQLMSRQKWYLFPIAIFLICISQPFNLYVYGLFLATYTVLRTYQSGTLAVKRTGILFLQMIGLGVLGMLLSAPLMMENIVQLLESPRGSGTNSYAHVLLSQPMFAISDKMQLGTSIMRLFSSEMMGSGNDYKGWQNILEAPLFYCGIPCLLLAPQAIVLLEKRVRIFFTVFLALWLMPILFPYFRHAFWLFTGDYYRAYSVVVAFFLIYYSVQALEQILKKHIANLIVLGITVAVLLILVNYPFFPDKDMVNGTLSAFVSFMLIAYAVLIYFLGKANTPVYIKYVFLLLVIGEVTYLSNISVNERDAVTATELAQKTGYNDYTVEAVNYLKQTDHSFYRIDKSYASSPAMHYSLNDGMAQGYNGSSGYSPFNQEYYIFYLQLMGVSNKNDELQSRWASGLSSRPLLESENRVKYILAKNNINPVWRFTCDSLTTFGDVKLLRNKYVLPVGYTYSTYIRESSFENLQNNQKDFVSLRACVVKDEDASKYPELKEFQLKDTIAQNAFTFDIYKSFINDLSKDTLVVDKFEDNLISGKINLSNSKMMYLSVPFDGGWNLKVDGQPYNKTIVDAGMTGIMLKKGAHTVEMAYDLRYFKKGLLLTLFGVVLYAGLWVITKRRKTKTTNKVIAT